MNRAFILTATTLLVCTALPACNGLHTPTAAEQGAKKMAVAAAKARVLASKIAFSPDVVSKTLTVDGGETKELRGTVLAPADAAKELRAIANEVTAAAGSDSQRKEAKTLATRMRRDAMVLDLMDLERIAQQQAMLAHDIESNLASIQSIDASGDPRDDKPAAARVRGSTDAKNKFQDALDVEVKKVSDARTALKPLEDKVNENGKEAESLDIEIESLRAQAATSSPSKALPLMIEAREKLNTAQDLRVKASEADQQAEPLRSVARISETAQKGNEQMTAFLSKKVEEAQKAAEGADARVKAATKRMGEFGMEAMTKAKQYAANHTDQFEPAVKALAEHFAASDLASKNPTDVSALAMSKARFYAIQIDAVDQNMIMANSAKAAGASTAGAVDALENERNKLLGQFKSAITESRDALSGVEAETAKPMLASITAMGLALGVDLGQPAAVTPATPEGAPEATPPEGAPSEPTNGDPSAAPADAAPAQGDPAPAQGDPAPAPTDPAPAPTDPAPAPTDPAPAPPEPEEPNK